MTTLENHKEILEQLIDDINEKIRNDQLLERQKILGFSTSEASIHLLAILLRSEKLISSGFMINHRYFASEKRAMLKLDFGFPQKEKIIKLLVLQEDFRNALCYGKNKDKHDVEKAIQNLFKLKELIESLLSEQK